MTTSFPSAVRSDLAPGGKLRVGLNYSNFLLVARGEDASPRGIVVDLANAIGRRAGVPVEFVGYDSPGKLADAATTAAWDIAFLAAEPARAAEIAFTPAYLEIDATYLVPAGSPLQSAADVDRDGVRIAVSNRSAYELFLSRTLKHAELIRVDGIDASFQLFIAEHLDALAGLRPRLLMDVKKLAGARVLQDRFTAIQQAIGTPKGRAAGAAYLREFVEEIKATGLVAQSIARHGVQGVSVAPGAASR